MNDDDRRMIRDAHQLAGAFAILVCDRDDALRELAACSDAAANADREWRKEIKRLTVELAEARAARPAAETRAVTVPDGGEPDSGHLPLTDEELREQVAREIAYAMGKGEAFDEGQRDVWLRPAMAAMRPTMAEVERLRRRVNQVTAAHFRDLESVRAALEAEQAGEQTAVAVAGQGATAAEVPGSVAGDDEPHGPAVAVGPAAVVIGPAAAAHVVADLAAVPFTGGCPNTPPCEHKRMDHSGVDAWVDPMPVCWQDGCRCGQPPAGWRRVSDQRVWNNGDTIPAGVKVLALDGAVYPFGVTGEWVNASLGSVVEVELIEHKHVGGSAGGPGECSAECACGTTFDGFDTAQEALTHLNDHIADATGEAVREEATADA